MSSGFGAFGGTGRCYPIWRDLVHCVKAHAVVAECIEFRDDYLECLHHSKEVRTFPNFRSESHKSRKNEILTVIRHFLTSLTFCVTFSSSSARALLRIARNNLWQRANIPLRSQWTVRFSKACVDQSLTPISGVENVKSPSPCKLERLLLSIYLPVEHFESH